MQIFFLVACRSTSKGQNPNLKPFVKQNGALLITALVFLVIMTILGVTVMRLTALDEKMAANYRCSKIAFEAAEAALRHAEQDKIASLAVGNPMTFFDGIRSSDDHQGRYSLFQNEPSLYSLFSLATWTTDNASDTFDASTIADISGSATQPRWMSKILAIDGPLNLSMEGETGVVFRNTARGTGCTVVVNGTVVDESTVMLRSIYRKLF